MPLNTVDSKEFGQGRTVGLHAKAGGIDRPGVDKVTVAQAEIVPGGHLHPKHLNQDLGQPHGQWDAKPDALPKIVAHLLDRLVYRERRVAHDIFSVAIGGRVLNQVVHHRGNVLGMGKVKPRIDFKKSHQTHPAGDILEPRRNKGVGFFFVAPKHQGRKHRGDFVVYRQVTQPVVALVLGANVVGAHGSGFGQGSALLVQNTGRGEINDLLAALGVEVAHQLQVRPHVNGFYVAGVTAPGGGGQNGNVYGG